MSRKTRSERPPAKPGRKAIGMAALLLLVIAAGLFFVSVAAQYQYLLPARHNQKAPSEILSGALDALMVTFSLLAYGMSRAGKPAPIERALIMVCALASAGMNLAEANLGSPRSIAAYVVAPIALAVTIDRLIAVVYRFVHDRPERSAWKGTGRVALYVLRLALAPWPTAVGLRRMALNAAPLPGKHPAGLVVATTTTTTTTLPADHTTTTTLVPVALLDHATTTTQLDHTALDDHDHTTTQSMVDHDHDHTGETTTTTTTPDHTTTPPATTTTTTPDVVDHDHTEPATTTTRDDHATTTTPVPGPTTTTPDHDHADHTTTTTLPGPTTPDDHAPTTDDHRPTAQAPQQVRELPATPRPRDHATTPETTTTPEAADDHDHADHADHGTTTTTPEPAADHDHTTTTTQSDHTAAATTRPHDHTTTTTPETTTPETTTPGDHDHDHTAADDHTTTLPAATTTTPADHALTAPMPNAADVRFAQEAIAVERDVKPTDIPVREVAAYLEPGASRERLTKVGKYVSTVRGRDAKAQQRAAGPVSAG